MKLNLTLTDADGIVLQQWELTDEGRGSPLPLRDLGAAEVIFEINDEYRRLVSLEAIRKEG